MEGEDMGSGSPGAVAVTTAAGARIVPRRAASRKSLAAVLVFSVIATVGTGATGDARASSPLYGISACALIEGVPSPSHPLRKLPALRAALASLEQAGADKAKNGKVLGRLDAFLAPLYREAEKAFARPRYDKDKETYDPFAPGPAKAFLERWVLAPNAPLEVGLERFEPVAELSAAMALAACRSDNRARAVAIGRGATGPERRALRAFAALLLLEDKRVDEARELVPGVAAIGDEGFLAPLILAELAEDPTERARMHEVAGRRIQNPDQETAWRAQGRRFADAPRSGP